MFWKYRRRLRQSLWRFGWYHITIVIFFILFANIMVIQMNFATLEGENYIDPGGTQLGKRLENIGFKHRVYRTDKLVATHNTRHVFENKMRKLLDIMETNLENTVSYGNTEPEIPVERYFPSRFLDCDDVSNITNWSYLASGWTKAVYRGTYKGSPVAIKTVDSESQEMSNCKKQEIPEKSCYLRGAKKIVKEIVVLQALANDNVLKYSLSTTTPIGKQRLCALFGGSCYREVLGFCLPRNADDNLWVAMVTELGESVDLIKLLQMSWEDRLRVSLDIAKIVEFLSRTPYGSMAMNDFRRQQFVLVDGTLKLSDVDDAGFVDPVCKTDDDCHVIFSSANFSQRTKCVQQRCAEFNEKRNVFNAGRDFVTFLLPHGAPIMLKSRIAKVVDGFSNLTTTSKQLLAQLKRIQHLYQSGWYMNRTKGTPPTKYKKLEYMDFAGLHDYRCRFSLSVVGCTISAFDQSEAEEVCDMDDECQGFVMSSAKTWTGRTLVHLKNGVDNPTYNQNTTLFLKPR